MEKEIEKLLTLRRVMEILSCSKPTVYRLIKAKKIKAFRLSSRGLRITKESLITHIEENIIDPEEYFQ